MTPSTAAISGLSSGATSASMSVLQAPSPPRSRSCDVSAEHAVSPFHHQVPSKSQLPLPMGSPHLTHSPSPVRQSYDIGSNVSSPIHPFGFR